MGNVSRVRCCIRQETAFPGQPGTKFTFKISRPIHLALKLRLPYWATGSVKLKVNDQPQEVAAKPQSYITLGRQWNDSDTVELTLPKSIHLHRATDNPNSVAVMFGPLVLAGQLGRDNYPPSDQAKDQNHFNRIHPTTAPALVSDDTNPQGLVSPDPTKPHRYWKLLTPEQREVPNPSSQ